MLEKFRRLLEVERELGKLFSGGGKRYAKLLAEEPKKRNKNTPLQAMPFFLVLHKLIEDAEKSRSDSCRKKGKKP